MVELPPTPPYTLSADEKAVQVMVYTASGLIWGDVVVKVLIRVSTWLKTNAAPDRVCLYNARAMTTMGGAGRPLHFREMHVALPQVLAFHMMPPAKDPVDYDVTEPNRKMLPVSVVVSSFRLDGCLRMAAQSSLAKFLEVTREAYLPVYDVKITNPNNPTFGTIQVPYAIVRQEQCLFTLTDAPA
ncbi:MAG TPA: hypothetical protein VF806_00550 [Anaerolineaceae bacterium]